MIAFDRTEIDRTVGARFELVAAAQPGAIAIAHGDKTWSYQQVMTASDAYKAAFGGLQPALPVALVFSHGALAIIAMIGAIRAGVPVIPIDASKPPNPLLDAIAACQIVATEPDYATWCRDHSGSVPVAVGPDEIAKFQATDHSYNGPKALPASPCVIYLTSGTTGGVKGAVRSHRSILRHAWHLPEYHGYGPGDRQAHVSSFAFGGSVPVIFGGLLSGGKIDVFNIKQQSASDFARAIGQRNITILQLTPSLMREVVDILASQAGDWQPRLIVVGGEQLNTSDIIDLRNRLGWTCPIIHRLASSEAGVIAEWQIDLEGLGADSPVPVGYEVLDREISILDEFGQPTATNDIGEIVITGDYLASGYWRRPDLSAEKFSPAPLPLAPDRQRLATGDMGRKRQDGRLEFLGRKDNLVKIRGYRVELGAIEQSLRSLPNVSDAAVVMQNDDSGKAQLIGYVQRARNAVVLSHQIRVELLKSMPDYMVPRRIIVLDAFPLTAGGKLSRHALPKPDRCRPPGLAELVAPETGMERVLAKIWAGILEIDEISRTDDFFDLGGDSLEAMKVALQLQTHLGFQFFETDLFQSTDLQGMAEIAENLSPVEV